MARRELSLGVEEEFLVVDAGSRALSREGPALLAEARRALSDDEVAVELHHSQIETGTPVCGSLADEQIICGCHVHVGIDDPEPVIEAMNRSRPWLSVILALSGNSPFWESRDTGYASYRTELWRRWPMAGTPELFPSRAEFDAVLEALLATGSIDEPVSVVRPELLRAATWRAARYGPDEVLVDVLQERTVPARQLVDRLLAFRRAGPAGPRRRGRGALVGGGHIRERDGLGPPAAGARRRGQVGRRGRLRGGADRVGKTA